MEKLLQHFLMTFAYTCQSLRARDQARHAEFVELLDKLCNQSPTDPAFWELYSQELAGDAVRRSRALAQTIRVNPSSPGRSAFSRVLWSKRGRGRRRSRDSLRAWRRPTIIWRNYFENANFIGRSEALNSAPPSLNGRNGQPTDVGVLSSFWSERRAYAVYDEDGASDDGICCRLSINRPAWQLADARVLPPGSANRIAAAGWACQYLESA